MSRLFTPKIANHINAFWCSAKTRLKLWISSQFRRKIFIRGRIIVDTQGRANFVANEPLSFWSFYDIWASLAILIGAFLAVYP